LTRIHYKAASDGKWGEHESTPHFLSHRSSMLILCDLPSRLHPLHQSRR
jgi:hypothetical protein